MWSVRQNGVVTDIRCETATEFVSVLDPLVGPFSQPAHLGLYVFRGVTSEQHDLLPAAFRQLTALLDRSEWVHPPLPTIGEQCEAEIETLQKFFDIAARQGLRLPEDSQSLRAQLEDWAGRFFHATAETPVVWPPRELLSLIALAQHYGVPTRALDWTWSSLTATYFAIRDVRTEQDSNIAVWVFSYFMKAFDRFMTSLYPEDRPLILFTAPGADNDNLRAQRGLFMSQVHSVTDRNAPFQPTSYERLLSKSVPSATRVPLAFRVIVPSREAPHIRWFLSSAGTTAGSLFPGFWGAAREFQEERLTIRRDALSPSTEFSNAVQRAIIDAFKSADA